MESRVTLVNCILNFIQKRRYTCIIVGLLLPILVKGDAAVCHQG